MTKRRRDSLATRTSQTALLLHEVRQPYSIVKDYAVPDLKAKDEVLIEVEVIGLNPIDWKAPDYGFGIPQLPHISGRELVGTVIDSSMRSRKIRLGDRVLAVSTDYRDPRKAAYQQYVVATQSNLAPLPDNITSDEGAAIGVAFVTSVLSLGFCIGIDFKDALSGPNLQNVVKKINPSRLPEDVRGECLRGIEKTERPGRGDWIAIWGASATCALMINQLARLVGLRTILILDTKKHAELLETHPGYQADAVVDDSDTDRAIETVRALTKNALRFGIDVVGRTTSELLAQCLQPQAQQPLISDVQRRLTPPTTPPSELNLELKSHLVGLSGLPKQKLDGIVHHAVPVKVFHEVSEVGEAIMSWLQRLLEEGKLQPPRILGSVEGFENINNGLDRMRAREISGGRLVAHVS